MKMNDECKYLEMFVVSEDENDMPDDWDWYCKLHYIWLDNDCSVCEKCQGKWSKEQIYKYKEQSK